jgi:hypothetical protein
MRGLPGALVLTLAVALAACGTCNDCGPSVGHGPPPVNGPAGVPSVTGTASKVTSTSFVVQDGKDPSGAALAASIKVPADTPVLRSSGGGFTKASLDDLQDGVAVQVWFTGPVAESYPVQATAGTIVLTG